MENGSKWYILNVMAGQENKVASEIRSMIAHGVVGNTIHEVLIPVKSVIKIKKGQKVQEAQKLFPGYVFISTSAVKEIMGALHSIPKVMGFLGGKNDPKPVQDLKMQEILNLSLEKESDIKNVIFEIGETLNIVEGPFESFSGTVEEFDIEKQKVKISVLIFGRATSVELDISQVERIS